MEPKPVGEDTVGAKIDMQIKQDLHNLAKKSNLNLSQYLRELFMLAIRKNFHTKPVWTENGKLIEFPQFDNLAKEFQDNTGFSDDFAGLEGFSLEVDKGSSINNKIIAVYKLIDELRSSDKRQDKEKALELMKKINNASFLYLDKHGKKTLDKIKKMKKDELS